MLHAAKFLATCLLSALPSTAFAQEAGGFPLIIEHALGIETLEAPAERIVFHSEEFIEVAIALGIAPAGVGLTRQDAPDGGLETLSYLPQYPVPGTPAAFNGAEPSQEAVLALDPDLIVFHYYSNDSQRALYERYGEVAPTIAFEGAGPESWKAVARAVAAAAGIPERAEAVIAQYDADVEALRREAVPLIAEHPEVAIVFAWGEYSGYFDARHAVGSTFDRLGFAITHPLGEAMDPFGFTQASAETVPDIDTDTIFVFRGAPSPYDPLLERSGIPVVEFDLPQGIRLYRPLCRTALYAPRRRRDGGAVWRYGRCAPVTATQASRQNPDARFLPPA